MGNKARKLNFLIEESVCRDLEELIPAGKRSKVVNEALRRELELIRRKKAVANLLTASSSGKRFLNREIVDGLARERGSH